MESLEKRERKKNIYFRIIFGERLILWIKRVMLRNCDNFFS